MFLIDAPLATNCLQEQLVLDLTNPSTKETALLELSKKRESFPELAPFLWHSFGTMAALLQEIVSIYPMLQPPSLTAHASNRVCNALALLQCVASHQETRSLFLQGESPHSSPPAVCLFSTTPFALPSSLCPLYLTPSCFLFSFYSPLQHIFHSFYTPS